MLYTACSFDKLLNPQYCVSVSSALKKIESNLGEKKIYLGNIQYYWYKHKYFLHFSASVFLGLFDYLLL